MYEVVWPLHRRHYLNVEEPITVGTAITVVAEPSSSVLPTPNVGRELTVRALLAAGCSRTRIGQLLNMDRKTASRLARLDVSAALHNGDAHSAARARLAASEHRGSTLKERDAATAWLDRALREPLAVVEPPRPTRVSVRMRPVARKAIGRASGKVMTAHPAPARPADLALEQRQQLVEQQQRILRRSLVLECVVKADALDPTTLRDVVTEFMTDVITAARRIGALLQPQS